MVNDTQALTTCEIANNKNGKEQLQTTDEHKHNGRNEETFA